MITVLIDHNIEGQAEQLWATLVQSGWLELVPIRFVTFTEAGLVPDSTDRVVWRFAQTGQMLLLTDNRNMKDEDALERVMREESTPTSLPVITVGRSRRLGQREYREACVIRLVEIILDLDQHRGPRRLFIP